MDSSVIEKLNTINKRFYNSTAKDFSDSRKYYWHGWREILPYLEELVGEKTKLRVLDVGCGNGRFGLFLVDYLPAIEIFYKGIDNNQALLGFADQKLRHSHLDIELQEVDLVDKLLDNSLFLDDQTEYDVIVLFGVLHHIPTYQLRKKLIQQLSKKLTNQGILVLTLWRFLDIERLSKKQIPLSKITVDTDQLDVHDYLLNWERGTPSYRYCHYTDNQEEQRLIAASKLELINSFESDGKEGKGNKYLILSNS